MKDMWYSTKTIFSIMKKQKFKGKGLFVIQVLCLGLVIMLVSSCQDDPVSPISSEEPVADMNDGYERVEWVDSGTKENGRIGGQIVDEVEVVIGSTPGYEVDHVLTQPGYIITGIGMRLDRDNVTTMRLERRFLNSDGTLGTRQFSNHGSDPTHPLEAWYAVPNGFAIVGVGVRAAGSDLTTLHVHYRAINSNARLTGEVLTAKRGSLPNHQLELDMIAGNEGAFDFDRTVATGFGFRVKNGDFTVIKQYAGELK